MFILGKGGIAYSNILALAFLLPPLHNAEADILLLVSSFCIQFVILIQI